MTPRWSVILLRVWLSAATLVSAAPGDSTGANHGNESAGACGPYTRHFVTSDPDARCLDGSPGSFLHKRGFGSGADKWMVFFQGGGWCYNPAMCYERSKYALGSSVVDQANDCELLLSYGGYLSGYKHASNSATFNFHYVLVHYCDGGSFAGDAEGEHRGSKLYFKGSKIRRGVIADLMTRFGMSEATDVVIAGASAGGLAVYLGIDDIRAQIHSYNDRIDVGGMADAGFFPSYSGVLEPPLAGIEKMTQGYKAAGDPPLWYPEEYDVASHTINYSASVRQTFTMMNVAAAAPAECIRQNANTPSNCMFAEYLLPTVQSPLFILQPKYDAWQSTHVLGVPIGAAAKDPYVDLTNSVGDALESKLLGIISRKRNVFLFLDSCRHHSYIVGQYFLLIQDSNSISAAIAFEGWVEHFFTRQHFSAKIQNTPRHWNSSVIRQSHTFLCRSCCYGPPPLERRD